MTANMQDEIAAAELALKIHYLAQDPETANVDVDSCLKIIADSVDLTEAPEDAVCSLVSDLMKFCEREKIDWNEEVMSRAVALKN